MPAKTHTEVTGNTVEVSWSHPHGYTDLQLTYEIIYFGYKKEKVAVLLLMSSINS